MGGQHPKTLLHLGDEGPMLKYLLEGLKRAGVEDLLVVTGFKPQEVQDYVSENWGEAKFIYNARHASWGNFHSVRMAVDQSPGLDLMVVNSDIVINPEVYTRVIAKEGDLVLAVQRRQRLDQEDMRVHLDKDRVLGISKDLKMARSHGEFCGVSMLRGVAHRVYADIATNWEWPGTIHGYYEDVYNAKVGKIDARSAEVAAGDYAEVDSPDDVAAALKVTQRHFAPAAV